MEKKRKEKGTESREEPIVNIINASRLRSDTAQMIDKLKKGEFFLLKHYDSYIGIISPQIPGHIRKKIKKEKEKKEKPGFPSL